MAAPKPRPLSTIIRTVGTTTVYLGTYECHIRDTVNVYPGGSATFPYPTELAQIATRLARHFGDPWQVKYDDVNNQPVFRTAQERLHYIQTAMQRLSVGGFVDISDEGPWKRKPTIANDLLVWPGTSSSKTTRDDTITQTKEQTTEMGSIETIITDIIDKRLAGHKPAMDEDAIRNLVGEAVKGVKPPRIEIKIGDTAKVLDKHTHPMFGKVLTALTVARQSTKWPFLVGPSGTGKSTMGGHLAEALGLTFLAFPANPTAMLHDILGFISPTTHEYKETPYVSLMRNGGVMLFDELDKMHPGIVSGLNMLLAQGIVVLPTGEEFPLHPDCYFIAGANTWGTGPDAQYVGSNQLDAATVNRFVRIPVDYDRDYEQTRAAAVLGEKNGTLWCVAIEAMRANRDKHKIDTIISTRDVIAAPTLVATGNISAQEAVDWTIVANLKADHKARLMEGVDLKCLTVKN